MQATVKATQATLLANFLSTKFSPKIYYIPAKHTAETLAIIEKQKNEVKELSRLEKGEENKQSTDISMVKEEGTDTAAMSTTDSNRLDSFKRTHEKEMTLKTHPEMEVKDKAGDTKMGDTTQNSME